jgi:endonuclease/exonuclease/phosphatase family metal-dependent hydrolase
MVLGSVQSETAGPLEIPQRLRVAAWNIERGKQLHGVIEALRFHPYLSSCDVLLLTETDCGMARSHNADVAREIARALGFSYAFAPCYLSLVKGSGMEMDIDGENELGLHGNAIVSRYPLENLRIVPLPNGIDKMASREQRIGRQQAVLADIRLAGGTVTVACVHLDANSSQRHRAGQMRTVLDALPQGAAVIGGDWNTTTFNSSTAFHAIMGYWLRVFMGPGNVIRNHYLHPYRWFERDLFQLIGKRGFEYKQSNVEGEHTIYYHIDDLRTHKGLAEWVPGWCFPFIRWALREHGGGCPLKIDWFATRGLQVSNARVIHDVREDRQLPLSDHDAIGVDVSL